MTNRKGFTLIEVLVSVFLLALGFTWFSSLQAHNLKTTSSAFHRAQAVMLANFMMDAMRANREAAITGQYNLGTRSSPVCETPTGTGLVADNQIDWFNSMKKLLGNEETTCGMVDCNASGCTVQVIWNDSRASGKESEVIEIMSKVDRV